VEGNNNKHVRYIIEMGRKYITNIFSFELAMRPSNLSQQSISAIYLINNILKICYLGGTWHVPEKNPIHRQTAEEGRGHSKHVSNKFARVHNMLITFCSISFTAGTHTFCSADILTRLGA
jgi:hypothetical protein